MNDVSEWDFLTENTHLDMISIGNVLYHTGDRVRLHPRGGADAFDMMLKGKIAIIEAIEQDAENKIHFAVVVEDDPGRELGFMRQPGHRFFFAPAEVEWLGAGDGATQ